MAAGQSANSSLVPARADAISGKRQDVAHMRVELPGRFSGLAPAEHLGQVIKALKPAIAPLSSGPQVLEPSLTPDPREHASRIAERSSWRN